MIRAALLALTVCGLASGAFAASVTRQKFTNEGPLVTDGKSPPRKVTASASPSLPKTAAPTPPAPPALTPKSISTVVAANPASSVATASSSRDFAPVEVRAAQPVVRSSMVAAFNQDILEMVARMPKGGTYATSAKATANLGRAVIAADEGRLAVKPDEAKPSFCSSATYLVLLMVVEKNLKAGRLTLDKTCIPLLAFRHQEDGVGVWGRWNANGPGTARLFHELGLGESFTDPLMAKPGDFLKIWWTDEIGNKEKGHSVIYLGTQLDAHGQTAIRYWSSNIPDGYGEKIVPLTRIKRMLFSRLTNLDAFQYLPRLPAKDEYLAQMKVRSTDIKEVGRLVGLP